MIIWLRSLIYFIGSMVITLVITPIMLLFTVLLPHHLYMVAMRFWCRLNLGWVRYGAGIRYKIIGLENLAPTKDTPHVIISNHQSAYETIIFPFIFPPHAFILKKELFNVPFIGWGLRKAQHIGIDRASGRQALMQMFRKSEEVFKKGRSIAIFPEGTRVPFGKEVEYKKGGFAIAKRLKCSIIPISHNTGLAWARNSFIKKPGTVTITIGPSISTDGKSVEEIRDETESWIRSHIKPTLDP